MNKIKIFLFTFFIFILSSCSFPGFSNKNLVINNFGTGELTSEKLKELSINDKEKLLFSEKELKTYLKDQKKNGPFYEELPRVNSYYSNNPFYEFYFLLSIKENNKLICDKIASKEKELCKDLFDYKGNKSKFIEAYLKSGEDKDFAINMFNVYKSVSNKTECKGINQIFSYLACKKILNKDFDNNKYFYKYTILEKSDYFIVKNSYKDLIKSWNLDNDFSDMFSRWLLSKNDVVK